MTEATLRREQSSRKKWEDTSQDFAQKANEAGQEPSKRIRSYFQLAYRQYIATVLRAARRRMHRGNWKGACGLLRLAGRYHRDPRLLARLGYAAIKANDHPLAILSLRAAASLSPRTAKYHVRLGSVYLEVGFPAEARACADRALEAEPTSPHPYALLAELRAAAGDRTLQLEHLHRALALSRSLRAVSRALLQLAEAYTDRANRNAAIDCCLRAIAVQPASGLGYLMLAHAGFYEDVAHPHVAAAEQLLRDPCLPEEDKRHLHFALGIVYDRHARWDQAFLHFHRGNALSLRTRTFPSREPMNDAKRRIAVFTAARIEEFARHGSNTTVPIFVVGMPRSGTTLIEQILDSHRKVHGLGESMELLQITQWLPAQLSWVARPYPECAEFLSADLVRQISDDYLARMVAAAAGAPRAVTKRPNDFWEVGLIHILFPKAKIIHCRRDPRDTCLSCYMQDFKSIAFASRLDHLASYYAQYERMMHHWRSVLKPSVMYELQYERLVQDPEGTVNDVLQFCELEPDDGCFGFFKNERPVHTASTWQVRKPIYQGSVGRWRNYAHFLQPLGRLMLERAWAGRTSSRSDQHSGKAGDAAWLRSPRTASPDGARRSRPKRTAITAAFLLVVFSLCAGYCRYRFGSLGATAAYLAGDRVLVPDRVLALTNLTAGSEVLLTYTLTNLAGRQVTVLGAQTSCGCAAIDHLPTTLAGGESTPIHVRLNVSSDEPRIAGRIVLFTDFEGQPTIPLGYNGIVEDARMEPGG